MGLVKFRDKLNVLKTITENMDPKPIDAHKEKKKSQN